MEKAVIIPALNEARHIAGIVESAASFSGADIIVIDDGSDDRTAEEAERAGALVIRHPFRMGYGVALQTGYKYCAMKGYKVIAQMDGDTQHDPSSLGRLFDVAESSGCDILVGSRFLFSGFPMPAVKLFAIRLFRWILKVTAGLRISDPTSGYQVLSKRAYLFFTGDSFPYDYPDANLLLMAARNGFKIEESPAAMRPNPEGRSMHSGFFKKAGYLVNIFLSIFITLVRGQSPYRMRE